MFINRFMRKKALSLVEITISMAILIMVMLPSFLAFSSGSHGIQMTESEFRAHSAALELMEQTISLPFNMIKPGFYEEDVIKNGANFADTDAKYHLSFSSDYKLSMTIEDIVKNNKVFFKKVTVNVKYPVTKNSDQKKDFSIKVIINNDNI
ncbi:MAG: hypothetical protein IKO19_00280 [Candidatus Riflebacteria bacterium]|nr:hypothetical protein [Candidatus Riflebacteria bacterium]MBR4569091.1 hypothetical protein [Candidatus Riflebacteria bacterium]